MTLVYLARIEGVKLPMKKKRYLIFTIVSMLVIFMFSSQQGENSYRLSNSVLTYLVGLPKIGPFVELYIRKVAHVYLYFLLGVSMNLLIYGFVYKTVFYNKSFRNKTIIPVLSMIICFLYACTDEIHQLFVPGRTGTFRDVTIDMMGVMMGTVVVLLSLTAKQVIKKRYSTINCNGGINEK